MSIKSYDEKTEIFDLPKNSKSIKNSEQKFLIRIFQQFSLKNFPEITQIHCFPIFRHSFC